MSKHHCTESNPFFKYEINQICIVCNQKLIRGSVYSIFNELSRIEPKTNIIKALEIVSNFKEMNIQNGPQYICNICYNNTISALKFWKMCEKSISQLKFFIEHQQKFQDNTYIDKNLIDLEITTTETSVNVEAKTELEISDKPALIQSNTNCIKKVVERDISKNHKQSVSNSSRQVPCNVCHKLYRHDYMRKHLRVHTGERPYQCTYCDSKFKGSTELKLHIASLHSENRQYLCNTCGKSFKLQAHLRVHLRTHTDERPYCCKVCGKRFHGSWTLKEHARTHTKERPLACEICGKCFQGRKNLKQHMISHEKVKRHGCHICGNRFTQAHSLRTHLSKHCKGTK